MKNNYLQKAKTIVVLLVLLLACFVSANANPVDSGRARQVAANFLNINRSADLMDVSAEAGFTNVYVFTTENSFVLLAADDRVQPILGYSLSGSFDVKNMPDNKRAWIQEYSDAIQHAIDNHVSATSEVVQQWSDLAEGHLNRSTMSVVVGPLLQTTWDQDSPYNYLCPSGTVTGCVATAMAQVMKYWNYPSRGIGTHSYTHATYGVQSADFQNTTYNWTNMLNSYSGSYNSTQRDAVATLMYHCGVSVDMNYGPSSGASSSATVYALTNYFNYSPAAQHCSRSNYEDATWLSMLKSDLNQNRPILYHGSHGESGHAFVFDGYNSSNYFHVNWGWSGFCDEYYLVSNLNPGPNGTGSGSYGIYDESQGAVLGIRPSTCTAGAPTNLNATTSGRNATLTWTAASGAASYNVYCNSVQIGNATSTTFAHLVPYGGANYYVRSVDSNGEMSTSSNIKTVTIDYPQPVVNDLTATVSGSNVTLNWTVPNWCYPSTPTATMTYGDGTHDGSAGASGYNLYWGHRYPASSLSSYNNMYVYKVSFYANYTGSYEVHVYKGSNGDYAQTQMLQQNVFVGATGWFDIDLSTPIQIDASQDLWVFMYDPESREFPCTANYATNNEANYLSISPTSQMQHYSGRTWLIRTFVSDGTYTYNLYRNGSSIATNLSSTTYNDNDLANGTYNYYVKTNYCAGESSQSNTATAVIEQQSDETLTVYDETATNCYVPAYIYYFDAFTRSQFVIPAGDLEEMAGAQISSMTFYTTSQNVPHTTVSNADVYLKEVNYTSIDAFESKASATIVYSGLFSIVSAGDGGKMTINFSTPYTYNGGNLLVGIDNTEENGFCYIQFYGQDVDGASISDFNYASMENIQPTQRNFIPKTTFAFQHACELTFTLNDSYGDGWNGAAINVVDAATNTILAAMSAPSHGGYNDPSTDTYTLTVIDGWNLRLEWVSGSWDQECSYIVTDSNGNEIFSGSGAMSEPFTFTVNCSSSQLQTIALSAGTNWASFNIEITLDDLKAALLEAVPNTEITIQGQNNNVKYNPSNHRWTGRLTMLDLSNMYKISVNSDCEITLEGAPVNPANHPVTISYGSNWIAFPLNTSMSPANAFAGFAQAGDKIQSQLNNASYNGTRWNGRMTALDPGQGYIYQSSQSGDRTLVFPSSK